MKVTLPGLAFVIRNEPSHGPTFPIRVQRNERLPVKEEPTLSPYPPSDTSVWGVGRDPQHAWPSKWSYVALDIAAITSHMSPWFLFPKVPGGMVVNGSNGAQLPVAGRPNIDSQGSVSYGSLATYRPDPTISPVYAKLLGG